jgi:putative exporter of polyketide antibiotics
LRNSNAHTAHIDNKLSIGNALRLTSPQWQCQLEVASVGLLLRVADLAHVRAVAGEAGSGVKFIAVFVLGLPQPVPDMEPFAYIPRIGRDFSPAPLLWLQIIDTAPVAVGVAAFRRRDARY